MVNVAPVYQLFITNSDGITTSNVTSNDYINLPLQLDSEYNITLVATGETLPSDILTITVPQGIVIIYYYNNLMLFTQLLVQWWKDQQ